jgi:hypothetical protein
MGNILNKKDHEEIKKRLADLKRDDLPIWGKMNVGEMLCHTADQVKLAMGEIVSEDKSTFMMRTLVKNLILAGMKPGKGVGTMAEINPHKLGSKPVNFDSDRDYLLRKIDDFIVCDEKVLKPHPVFGKLSKKQWGKLVYSHLDHHLSQFGS